MLLNGLLFFDAATQAGEKYTCTDCGKIGMNRVEQLNALALLRLLSAVPLSERQRQVLDLRSQGLSYVAVGRHLQISGERVRQIEARLRTIARRLSEDPFYDGGTKRIVWLDERLLSSGYVLEQACSFMCEYLFRAANVNCSRVAWMQPLAAVPFLASCQLAGAYLNTGRARLCVIWYEELLRKSFFWN